MKQPSLFVFDENSRLEGIMHYNKKLNDIVSTGNLWRLNDVTSVDDAELFEEDEDLEEDYLEGTEDEEDEEDEDLEEYGYLFPD